MSQCTLALVVTYASFLSVTPESLTFPHRDPKSGRMLSCNKCPPGSFMRAPCTPHTQTDCAECPFHHFTQFHNYLPKCLYCSTFCGQHQVVKQECTPLNNRVCECKEGYHMWADFCVRHRSCPPGQGVKQRGSVVRNTECQACPPGTFSAVKSATAACVPHTSCADSSQRVALKGSSWHDNICMSCKEQETKGTLAPLREIFPALLNHELRRLGKVRKLARHLLGRDEAGRLSRAGGGSSSSERARLLAALEEWGQRQPEARLRQLPSTLGGEMYALVDELENKISEIERRMEHCECNTIELQGTCK